MCLASIEKCASPQSNVLGLDWPCVDSPRLLGMPNQVEYTTWHTYWKELENKQEMKHSRFMKWNNYIN
jgi:hypothetical protein